MRFSGCWSSPVGIYGHWLQDIPQPKPESWGSGRVSPANSCTFRLASRHHSCLDFLLVANSFHYISAILFIEMCAWMGKNPAHFICEVKSDSNLVRFLSQDLFCFSRVYVVEEATQSYTVRYFLCLTGQIM